jgi:DNA-directed RNA polymerase subunit RPC12/RpoP
MFWPESIVSWIGGKTLGIASAHQKAQVIAPVLLSRLPIKEGVSISEIPTDELGTFSGEIPRTLSPGEAAKAKARMGFEASGIPLQVSTEASFYSHPQVMGLSIHEELVLLADFSKERYYWGLLRSLETWGPQISLSDLTTAHDWLTAHHQKGNHWMVIPSAETKHKFPPQKALPSPEAVIQSLQALSLNGDSFQLVPDYRAHLHPGRMQIIEQATHQLVDTILSICPDCNQPGFAIQSKLPGLPCKYCGSPTQRAMYQVRKCSVCGIEAQEVIPNQPAEADPIDCEYCNP